MPRETVADYRTTLNLPQTDFPMRADLPAKEPARVAWWRETGVYERRLAKNRGNRQWILHDGPPYANGEMHMGHFVNRVLKDVFVKTHLLDGAEAIFVPGWDMHGLPIEFETLKHLQIDFKSIDPVALRAKCRERALYWLDRQRDAILRMGVLGEYDRPYRTIDPEFEATVVETLADLAQERQLYKGLRATLWCTHDETALADAEIEYRDRVSPSIYVRFPATDEQRAEILRRSGVTRDAASARLAILIWTTTPWTLPANVAIAVNPEASYGIYRRADELIVIADALAERAFAHAGDLVFERLGGARGTDLIGATVRHPFADRDSVVVGAEYVELDTGTGAVHTAPGHGADDYETGMRFGLPVLSPVDGSGHFTREAGPYAGMQIFAANEAIVADLAASGTLFARSDYEHSYPHCWRCKNPLIFRATAQWFIALDANELRQRLASTVPSVTWFPNWGAGRMLQMIENHPEWCISRQRTWGTPIPAVVCRACGETSLDPGVARQTAQVFRERGTADASASDLWWTEPVETFLPDGFVCPNCDGTSFEKEFNIVDIWFESGVTHRAVLRPRGMHWPADLYLEGSDQFRGWFRSNLITAVATMRHAPYRNVVATGWVVDAQGRAMHKSSGNYIGAVEGMERYGADVLRLWLASVEFTADMRLGAEQLQAIGAVYRNVRNRLRILLGLIADLRPDHLVARDDLEPLDRLALVRLDELVTSVVAAYKTYRLHDAYLALVAFDGEDLSSFYIDVLKDPLYSGATSGARRRSGQTTVFTILQTLCALYAPLLSFTAEETWSYVPEALRAGHASVFDLEFPAPDARDSAADLELWSQLKALRGTVAANTGDRDFALAATVYADARSAETLRVLGDGLREALVVSALTLVTEPSSSDDERSVRVEVAPAPGERCVRCRKTLPLAGDPVHPQLCRPCLAIVTGVTAPAANRPLSAIGSSEKPTP